jgi:hypothetical protein
MRFGPGVSVIKHFLPSLTTAQSKLERFFILPYYLRIRPEPIQVEHATELTRK